MYIEVNVKKLQYLRISNGYTRNSLAKIAGISKLAITRIEKKEVNPRPDTIKKICIALNIKFDDICLIKE